MKRFINKLRKSNKTDPQTDSNQIPDCGPVNIENYEQFLEMSKEQFFMKWATLLNEEEQKIKIKDKNTLLKNLEKQKLIGSGSFGQVYLVKIKHKQKYHAMKILLKRLVVKNSQVNNTKTEKLVLQCTNCPFHTRLDYFFKDNSYLYFVLPFIQGGELYHYLQQIGKLDEDFVRFYLAQVILAIEYLHYLDIIYRDIKPENMMLDHTGYIKLTDFGFCKCLQRGSQRTYTFCGTMDYLAPEVILNDGYGKAADWWGIGVLAYELATGNPPFQDEDELNRLKKIISLKLNYPDDMSTDLQHLISQTLQKDLSRRYGNLRNGVNDFKNHKWFEILNWQAVICRKARPPYLPEVDGPSDTRHFKELKYSLPKIAASLEYSKEFADF